MGVKIINHKISQYYGTTFQLFFMSLNVKLLTAVLFCGMNCFAMLFTYGSGICKV